MNNENKIISMLEKHSILLEILVTRVEKLDNKVDRLETGINDVKTIQSIDTQLLINLIAEMGEVGAVQKTHTQLLSDLTQVLNSHVQLHALEELARQQAEYSASLDERISKLERAAS